MGLSKEVARDFSGRVAVITGSSSGIGARIAILFASYGAQVVINGLKECDAVEVSHQADREAEKFWAASRLSGQPPQATLMVGDITDLDFARRLIGETVKRFGRLDVLINNAGASGIGLITDANILANYERMMNLNFRSAVHLTHLAAPHLEKVRGSILNIGSILSQKPSPNNSMYCCSKAALDAFTRSAAVELSPRKIRVNGINPGPVKTSFLNALGASTQKADELYTALQEREPIGRIGEVNDIACACAFLASEEAAFITGSILVVDGGISLV